MSKYRLWVSEKTRRTAGSAAGDCSPAASSPRRRSRCCTRRSRIRVCTTRSGGLRPAPRRRTAQPRHALHRRTAHATGGQAAFSAAARASTTRRTASTRPRSCATSTTAPRGGSRAAASCASGSSSPSTRRSRSRPGVRLPGLDLQRPRPGPDPALPRGRAAADPLRERLRAPAHDPLPRHPPGRSWTACRASARARRRSIEPGKSTSPTSSTRSPFGLHLYHCHVSPLA